MSSSSLLWVYYRHLRLRCQGIDKTCQLTIPSYSFSNSQPLSLHRRLLRREKLGMDGVDGSFDLISLDQA